MAAPFRHIAHLDLDCFFVSVERIKDPSLLGKPVIVGGSPSGRGVVASASYEARACGVRSAMPTAQALRLCPQAIVVRGRHGEYSDVSRRLYERMLGIAPVVERASIDELYFDLTGCERLYHDDLPGFIARLQRQIAEEFSLPCTIALASNKLIAKVAANSVKPNGIISVPHGAEREFLAPFPIEVIPGIGPKTAEILRRRGFATVADLQRAPAGELARLLGTYGDYLAGAANGIGSQHVQNDHVRKSISREETFAADISDLGELERNLFTLVEDVCSTLRALHWKTRTVSLKLRFRDFRTITRQQTLEPTNYDPEVFAAASQLLRGAFDGRTSVRLIGVGLAQFTAEEGLSLFDVADRKSDVLNAVDKLRKKFGREVLHVGGA
jgi:DNA polymerase-4